METKRSSRPEDINLAQAFLYIRESAKIKEAR